MNWTLDGTASAGALIALIGLARALVDRRRPAPIPEKTPHRGLEEPISSREFDALGRAAYVELVATDLRGELVGESSVVAITGAWGSGKTSFLNMLRESLRADPPRSVFTFNPWLFSGAEQLIVRFFSELSGQLQVDLPGEREEISKQLEAYGQALAPFQWIPVAGPWIGRAGQLVVASSRLRGRSAQQGSTEAKRDALGSALLRLDEPIFVIVDDVDRLEASEIRELFRLVRLAAHLPNVTYILAFDQEQVERALGSVGIDGRAYLEKIVQRSYHLPRVPQDRLLQVLLETLTDALEGLEVGPLDEAVWSDVLAEVVLPLVSTLRDVKRYALGIRATAKAVGDEVALADLLGLEAVRIFLPTSFSFIALAPGVFAGAEPQVPAARRQGDDPRLNTFLQSGTHPEVLRALCERIFPGTLGRLGGSHYGSSWLSRWRRDRRLAHPEVLNFYLHRIPTEALLAARAARLLVDAMKAGDAESTRRVLEVLEPGAVEHAIESLEDYEEEFDLTSARTGLPVLAQWYGRLPDSPRGMFQFSPDLKISRVVLRLLKAVPEDPDRIDLVRSAIDRLGLWGRYELVGLVGHRENVGQMLVDEETARQLESSLRTVIAEAGASELPDAPALPLLHWTLTVSEGSDRSAVDGLLENPRVGAAVLRSSVTEVRSQALGSRAVRREPRLSWDSLVHVFGSEAALSSALPAIERLYSDELGSDDRLRDAIALVHRYLSGWRPRDFPGGA